MTEWQVRNKAVSSYSLRCLLLRPAMRLLQKWQYTPKDVDMCSLRPQHFVIIWLKQDKTFSRNIIRSRCFRCPGGKWLV